MVLTPTKIRKHCHHGWDTGVWLPSNIKLPAIERGNDCDEPASPKTPGKLSKPAKAWPKVEGDTETPK